jgi:hypothetical protein
MNILKQSVAAIALACIGTCMAGEPPKEIAVGDWSESVTDNRGYSVRGRLVLTERPHGEHREVTVYIELQDASDARGHGMRIFCDMGKTDLSGKTKTGLTCELHDEDDKPVESTSFPFGGGVPKSEWITLPTDATMRLRASPFGIYRPGAKAICPHLNVLWVIDDDDPKDYFLSGTFTVDPEEGRKEVSDPQIWRGTLTLPAARIAGKAK